MAILEDLDLLERQIRQLQIEWEKFFAGTERKPPGDLRTKVEALIRSVAYAEIRNNGDRYRYQSLSTRYSTMNELWNKRLRAMEEGRPAAHGPKGMHGRPAVPPPPPPGERRAAAAAAAAGDQHAIAVVDQVGHDAALAVLVDGRRHGAGRHLDVEVLAAPPGAVRAFAVAAAPRLELGVIAEVDQGVEIRCGGEVDRAAPATVAAVGTAARHELLATEAHAAVAAVTGDRDDVDFIDEHGWNTPAAGRSRWWGRPAGGTGRLTRPGRPERSR